MSDQLQTKIIRNLLTNEEYTRLVVPNLELDYFTETSKVVFKAVVDFVAKYNKLPTKGQFLIDLESDSKVSAQDYGSIKAQSEELFTPDVVDKDWMIDATEKWCKDRAIHNAILESVLIKDGKHKDLTIEAIPDLLQKALAVSFDKSVGHDYIADWKERFEHYTTEVHRLKMHLKIFNDITQGGLRSKSLNIIMASTGVGKSTIMCDLAANHLMDGKNVLYISMEMSEIEIAERIDANLLDVDITKLNELPESKFGRQIMDMQKKHVGSLKIKEYPSGAAHSGHFRALIRELEMKDNFKPDVVFIDYINICASSRMKRTGDMYGYIKSVAEEIRGLAQEFDFPIWSATQSNRGGYNNDDPDLSNTSESFGLPATADLFLVAISNPELESAGRIRFKQLKNRHGSLSDNNSFVVGVTRSKMRLYDVDQTARVNETTNDDVEDIPVFDQGSFSTHSDFNTEGFKL